MVWQIRRCAAAVAQQRAKRRLPKSVYGALIAGTEAGLTKDDNVAAFSELGLRPITAGQSPERSMETEVMGQHLSMPVIISPTGVQAVHPDGEVAVARAAVARGIPMGLSSFSSKPMDEVMATGAATFFQIYWAGDRDSMVARMERAKAAGAVGMILTLDWSFVHSRDWGSPAIPESIGLKTMIKHGPEAIVKPRWLIDWLKSGGIPQLGAPNFRVSSNDPVPGFFDAYGTWMGTPPPSWDDVAWLRAQWDGPFMVKGINRADEASQGSRRWCATCTSRKCRRTAATEWVAARRRFAACPRSSQPSVTRSKSSWTPASAAGLTSSRHWRSAPRP